MTEPISAHAWRGWRAAAPDVTEEEIRAIAASLNSNRGASPAARLLGAFRAGESIGRARQRREDDERRRLDELDHRAVDYLGHWWLPANHRDLDVRAVEAIRRLLDLTRELGL